MSQIDKKAISEALIKALNREDLHTCEAARYLNLKSCYLSMAKNEKNWSSMTIKAWARLEEWYNTNSPITMFKIPEGEPIVEQVKYETQFPEILPKMKEKPAAERIVNFLGDISPIAGTMKKEAEPEPLKLNEYPPKFNYDFLKDNQFLSFKEMEAEFMDRAAQILEKLDSYMLLVAPESPKDITQKLCIDIELNIVVNGQRIKV